MTITETLSFKGEQEFIAEVLKSMILCKRLEVLWLLNEMLKFNQLFFSMVHFCLTQLNSSGLVKYERRFWVNSYN